MIRKSLSSTICLTGLSFMIAILLATSSVEGQDGGEGQAQGTDGVVGGVTKVVFNTEPICYNNEKEKVKCSKKRGIIIGAVVGSLFVLLCALYLYGTWAGRRKGSSTAEENEPLSDESKAVSDCEKGIVEASKNKDADDSVIQFPQRPNDLEGASGTSPTMSDPPSYDRPPGLTYDAPPGMLGSGHTSSTKL